MTIEAPVFVVGAPDGGGTTLVAALALASRVWHATSWSPGEPLAGALKDREGRGADAGADGAD
ncbi:MAG: hypothetical protein M3320_10130, partial [Actinomycetota bacterium]|nr:hypothetical protein [Actinomycetota bacterium]